MARKKRRPQPSNQRDAVEPVASLPPSRGLGAGPWRRVVAMVLDSAVAGVVGLAVLAGLDLVGPAAGMARSQPEWVFVVAMWSGMLVYAPAAYMVAGRTAGQQLAGLRVCVAATGTTQGLCPPTRRRLVLRVALGWLLATSVLWPFNLAWTARRQRRSWIDRWTSCVLIPQPTPGLESGVVGI